MNIIVCMKQVYDLKDLKLKAGEEFTPQGLDRRVNSFDVFALEAALTVKDQNPQTKVIVLSMGAEHTERCLIEGLSKGADKAYRLNSSGFLDTVATSRRLAQAIHKIEKAEGMADIIITGIQSTDSGNGIVACMLSRILSRTLVSSAAEISLTGNPSKLEIVKRCPDGFEKTEHDFPLIISATKLNHEVRYPSFPRIRQANQAKINIIEPSPSKKAMSSTELIRIAKPGRRSRNVIVNDDVQAGTQILLRMLQEDNIFTR